MSTNMKCRFYGETLQQHVNGNWVDVPTIADPPPPPPVPEPGELTIDPVIIDGEPWTFKTPPPSLRQVRQDHPRLLVTSETLLALRGKLNDLVYGSSNEKGTPWQNIHNSGSTLALAFRYLINNEVTTGRAAVTDLLNGNATGSRIGRRSDLLVACLVYDWCHDLMNHDERVAAFNVIKSKIGYTLAEPTDRESWYGNDAWNAHTLGTEPHIWGVLPALAAADDGVDDDWCDMWLSAAYDNHPLTMGPYGGDGGYGILDVLNSIALDTGGIQAGDNGTAYSNYAGFYFQASIILLRAWETATGEAVVKYDNFHRLAPEHWWYEFNGEDSTVAAMATLEYLTGLYPGRCSGLAQGLLQGNGYSNSEMPLQMILGDRRVIGFGPVAPNLPTAKYLRGADLFVSRTGWADTDSVLQVHCPYLDSNRFETDYGIFEYSHRGHVLLCGAEKVGKQHASPADHSGLWIVDRVSTDKRNNYNHGVHGSTYWGGRNNDDYSSHPRAIGAYELVTDPLYRTNNPVRTYTSDTLRLIEIDMTPYWVAKPVHKTIRTIAHRIEDDREYLVIYDVTDIGDNLDRAWSLRLPTTPAIDGITATWSNWPVEARAVFEGPFIGSWHWSGGLGNEWIDPWGGDGLGMVGKKLPKAGYSIDQQKRLELGLGNLFLMGGEGHQQQNYLVIIEIGETGFEPRKPELSDLGGRIDGDTIRFEESGE